MRSGVDFFRGLMPIDPAAYGKEFSAFSRTAKRFELLPQYVVESEQEDYARWRRGESTPTFNSDWVQLVANAAGRGAVVRRVRSIPKDCSNYLAFEITRGYTESSSAGERFSFHWNEAISAEWPDHSPLIDAWIFDDLRAYAVFYDVRGVYLGAKRIAEADTPPLVASFDRLFDIGRNLSWALQSYVPGDLRSR